MNLQINLVLRVVLKLVYLRYNITAQFLLVPENDFGQVINVVTVSVASGNLQVEVSLLRLQRLLSNLGNKLGKPK
jgi:hypothetical protein